jgi:HEAT repeat protein
LGTPGSKQRKGVSAVNPSELIEQLNSDNVDQRRQAAQQATMAAEALRAFAVPLLRAVGDDDEAVSECAVATLEEMGPPDAAAVGELAQMLSHQNADVGYWAATLLGRCGQSAESSVPALTASLSPPAADIVRQRSAWALGKIGPAATVALPALQQAAASDDARLARLAKTALEQINTK